MAKRTEVRFTFDDIEEDFVVQAEDGKVKFKDVEENIVTLDMSPDEAEELAIELQKAALLAAEQSKGKTT